MDSWYLYTSRQYLSIYMICISFSCALTSRTKKPIGCNAFVHIMEVYICMYVLGILSSRPPCDHLFTWRDRCCWKCSHHIYQTLMSLFSSHSIQALLKHRARVQDNLTAKHSKCLTIFRIPLDEKTRIWTQSSPTYKKNMIMSPATYIYNTYRYIYRNLWKNLRYHVCWSILLVVESSSHQARLMSFVLLNDTAHSIIQEFSIKK